MNYAILIFLTTNLYLLEITSEIESKKEYRVFVNYAYSESRDDAKDNLRFFLHHGLTKLEESNYLKIDYGLVVNGPCTVPQCSAPQGFIGKDVNILTINRENTGFDYGAHAAMLEKLDSLEKLNVNSADKRSPYDAYIFLNAGVTGPFYPSYMPDGWHWTEAFTSKLKGGVGVVGTSAVCLPPWDHQYGPRIEGFAFALSNSALRIVREKGTSFQQHQDKFHAILWGEYNMTKVLLENDVKMDTLLMAYQGKDWTDESHWNCNSHKHPSREETYFGISEHPLETIFHKTYWKGQRPVLEKYVTQYKEFKDGKKLLL